jgi:hypothetical protein
VHAPAGLLEWILAEQAPFAIRQHAPPLHAIGFKLERPALYFDKEQPACRIKHHEVALPLDERSLPASAQPVKAVENLDPAWELTNERLGHFPFAGIVNFGRVNLGEEACHTDGPSAHVLDAADARKALPLSF